METLPNNFLALDETESRYETSRFVVMPIPYDAAATWMSGARHGPAAVITASQHCETFDEELEIECYKSGIATLDPIEPNLAGPEQMHQDLFKAARRVVRDGKFLLGLGGDHSISSALARAAKATHKKVSVLQIDAHCDLRDSYYGSPYCHATVMRRIVDMDVPIVQVGIRAVAPDEHRFLRRRKMRPITARDCHMEDDWIDRALNALSDTVYVTIDIDGFDPAFAPGTGTPEPGGLDWYQVTGLLRLVAAEKQIVAGDIVEVMPIPGQVVTEFLAARLAYKLMGYVQARA